MKPIETSHVTGRHKDRYLRDDPWVRPRRLGFKRIGTPMFSRREVITMRAALLGLSLFVSLTAQGLAQATRPDGHPVGASRIERSQTKQRALSGEVLPTSTTQP